MSANHLITPADSVPSVDYRRLGLISLGHLTNDMYGNLLSSLAPYLVIRGVITTTWAGLVLLVYLVGSSVPQPFFGVASDRSGRKIFAVLGPLWVGVAACLFAWQGSIVPLVIVAGLAGVGTAAFHPQAAAMVHQLSQTGKGWSMSIFSMGGNVGFAIGPALAAAIATVGFRWAPLILVPGCVLTVFLALYAPSPATHRQTVNPGTVREAVARSWRTLTLIVSVIALRSGVQYALIIFLPLYFHARGYAPQLGSYFAFVLSLSGAAGGLVGGRLSDRSSRKGVVVVTMTLSAPFIFLALQAPIGLVWPLVAMAGAALLASNSVTVVQGQELLPANVGVASGLTLGIGFGLSGAVGTGMTALADHIGVSSAVLFVPMLALLGAGLAALVPDAPRAREEAGAARAELAGP